jgi:hypothetical protein
MHLNKKTCSVIQLMYNAELSRAAQARNETADGQASA